MIDEIWDSITDAFQYATSLEWFSDGLEFISGMFEGLGELSLSGLTFGIATVAFIYFLRDYMLMPFLIHMGTMEAYFWGSATYLISGIVGYLIGKKLFEE